jgi:periplasmic protein TonB
MVARIALLGAVCLFLLSSVAQEKSDKPSTTPKSTAFPQGAITDVGPRISRPEPIFSPGPDYPLSVRKGKHKIQGICVVGLTVDEHGRARDVHVTRSLDRRLDQNAIEAVKQWKFKPAMRDGKPVAVLISVEVEFRLN